MYIIIYTVNATIDWRMWYRQAYNTTARAQLRENIRHLRFSHRSWLCKLEIKKNRWERKSVDYDSHPSETSVNGGWWNGHLKVILIYTQLLPEFQVEVNLTNIFFNMSIEFLFLCLYRCIIHINLQSKKPIKVLLYLRYTNLR